MRSALPLVALAIALAVGASLAAPAPAEAAVRGSTTMGRPMRIVHGYSGQQLENAAIIIAVAERMGLGSHGALLGVMTAMGESSLRNLDHGDGAINPDGSVADSVGLFQQQHWWGTLAQRMTPAIAAARFFQRLRSVPHWKDLPPTAAAHAVQVNADPHFYTRFLPAAEAVVAAVRPATADALRRSSAARHLDAAIEQSGRIDFDLSDLPSLPDMPVLHDLADVPDFTGLGGAGVGDAVLDELRDSGVALPDEPLEQQQEQPLDQHQQSLDRQEQPRDQQQEPLDRQQQPLDQQQ